MATRNRFFHKRQRPGTAPGTIPAPARDAAPPVMHVIAYGPDDLQEATLTSIAEIREWVGRWPSLWLNVDGLEDTAMIQQIGELFHLHPLALEDTINTHQRPKAEDYGDTIFTVCRMLNGMHDNELDLEQISLFLGRDFVISFQESPGDCWNSVRERLRRGKGKHIRNAGPDYLAYALIDTLVDGYFPPLEVYGDKLDELEDHVLDNPDRDVVISIQAAKRALYMIRHAIWPMREVLSQLNMHEDLVAPETKVFLRDCQDHTIQLLDIIESYRERVSGLMDIYLSTLSIRMNQVMKVLAIITTIFMPLSLITGIYGMNFDRGASPYNMPELGMRYGYPSVLGVMVVIVITMLLLFRHFGWLGNDTKNKPDR